MRLLLSLLALAHLAALLVWSVAQDGAPEAKPLQDAATSRAGLDTGVASIQIASYP